MARLTEAGREYFKMRVQKMECFLCHRDFEIIGDRPVTQICDTCDTLRSLIESRPDVADQILQNLGYDGEFDEGEYEVDISLDLDQEETVRMEMVNHPQHYGGDTTYEVIKVLEAWNPLMAYYFCVGNSIKYHARAGKKDDEGQDLAKGEWYATKAREIHGRLDGILDSRSLPDVDAELEEIAEAIENDPDGTLEYREALRFREAVMSYMGTNDEGIAIQMIADRFKPHYVATVRPGEETVYTGPFAGPNLEESRLQARVTELERVVQELAVVMHMDPRTFSNADLQNRARELQDREYQLNQLVQLVGVGSYQHAREIIGNLQVPGTTIQAGQLAAIAGMLGVQGGSIMAVFERISTLLDQEKSSPVRGLGYRDERTAFSYLREQTEKLFVHLFGMNGNDYMLELDVAHLSGAAIDRRLARYGEPSKSRINPLETTVRPADD